MDPQLPADPGNRIQDFPVGLVFFVQVPDQVHIKLDQIHFHFAEHIQGGISVSEVIQPYTEAIGAERGQLLIKPFRRGCHILLRDFNDEVILSDAEPADIMFELKVKAFSL